MVLDSAVSLKDLLFPDAIISPDTVASLDYLSYYVKLSFTFSHISSCNAKGHIELSLWVTQEPFDSFVY